MSDEFIKEIIKMPYVLDVYMKVAYNQVGAIILPRLKLLLPANRSHQHENSNLTFIVTSYPRSLAGQDFDLFFSS